MMCAGSYVETAGEISDFTSLGEGFFSWLDMIFFLVGEGGFLRVR